MAETRITMEMTASEGHQSAEGDEDPPRRKPDFPYEPSDLPTYPPGKISPAVIKE